MFSNILIICTMSIQGKSLAGGTPHDEMVESFGNTRASIVNPPDALTHLTLSPT